MNKSTVQVMHCHNIAYGPRTHGITNKVELDEIVERALRDAAIWDEVKDRLKKNVLGMSGGQQQRLCIARALAVQPKILLMDLCSMSRSFAAGSPACIFPAFPVHAGLCGFVCCKSRVQ